MIQAVNPYNNSTHRYDHPNFSYDQYVKEEAARYEAASKVTAAALVITPEKQAARAEHASLVVGLYLGALLKSRPKREAEADRLAKIPYCGGAYYTSVIAPQKSTRVGPKVKSKRAKRKLKSTAEIVHTPGVEAPEDLLPLASIEGSNKLAGHKKALTRLRIETAYADKLANKDGSEDAFYRAVYKLFERKAESIMFEVPECDITPQDVASEQTFQVFETLDKFKGNVGSIYPWLCKVIHRNAWDALKSNRDRLKLHVPLIVEIEDADGNAYKEDNPLLHPNSYPIEFRRVLPDWIKGIDLEICGYIREGYTYEKIGRVMAMTENAVTQRVAKMKARFASERMKSTN